MDCMDKTLFTNNEEELQKIYEEEVQKLKQNEFKMDILKKMSIEDFPRDLPESSKKNIEKALLAVRIKDHINLKNGQKLLGLDDFEVGRITLSYTEKKLIREFFEQRLEVEKKRQQLLPTDDTSMELVKEQEKFIALQKENTDMMETLAELKLQELELLRQVAEEMVGPTQKKLVKGILDEAKTVQLQTSRLNQVIAEMEMTRTRHSKQAFDEMSSVIDDLLKEKHGSEATKSINK